MSWNNEQDMIMSVLLDILSPVIFDDSHKKIRDEFSKCKAFEKNNKESKKVDIDDFISTIIPEDVSVVVIENEENLINLLRDIDNKWKEKSRKRELETNKNIENYYKKEIKELQKSNLNLYKELQESRIKARKYANKLIKLGYGDQL